MTVVYEWQAMDKCAGADFRKRGTRFVRCERPVERLPISTLPLCEEHLAHMIGIVGEAYDKVISNLKREVKEAGDKALQESFEKREAISEQQAEWRQTRSRVYFLRCGQYIKIGFSTDVDKRVDHIRRLGGVLAPEGLDLSKTVLIADVAGEMTAEKSLHKKFNHLRVVGEWFRAEPELLSFIEKLEEAAA